METFSKVVRRATIGVRDRAHRFLAAVGEVPVHCSGCGATYRLVDALTVLSPLLDIPAYHNRLKFFCPACAEAIRNEYRFRCARCGARHNRADSQICIDCDVAQYPEETRRVAYHNIRAIEHGERGNLKVPEWLQTLNDFSWRCYICGGPFEALDHYIPIAKGGGTTADNCFPICKHCNSAKGALHPDELVRPSPRSPEVHQRLQAYQAARWPRPSETHSGA